MEALTSRVRSILFQPRSTWKEIDTEFTKPGQVWGRYIVPLAAIGPLAGGLGRLIFGKRIAFTTLTSPVTVTEAATWAAVAFVLALVSVFALQKIIALLAPGFGGQRNDVQALKTAAYSTTAAWLGGVFAIHARLGLVTVIFALYSLYLLYVGLPILMKVPQDREMGYTAVVIIAAIVIFLIVTALTAF